MPPMTWDTVNSGVALVWTRLQTAQATFLAANGYYWQGLWTCTVPPDLNTGTKTPDRMTVYPTDQPISWTSFKSNTAMTLASKLAASLCCDVYKGPLGIGYTLRARVTTGGVTYEKVLVYGPETWLAHDWQALHEVPV